MKTYKFRQTTKKLTILAMNMIFLDDQK